MFLKERLVLGLSCIFLANALVQKQNPNVNQLNEENWDRMLTGEWMIKL